VVQREMTEWQLFGVVCATLYGALPVTGRYRRQIWALDAEWCVFGAPTERKPMHVCIRLYGCRQEQCGCAAV
jgi:hypothetical protein